MWGRCVNIKDCSQQDGVHRYCQHEAAQAFCRTVTRLCIQAWLHRIREYFNRAFYVSTVTLATRSFARRGVREDLTGDWLTGPKRDGSTVPLKSLLVRDFPEVTLTSEHAQEYLSFQTSLP